MKKFSLMLVLLASLALISCDDDDDDDNGDNTPVNVVALAQGNPELSILVDALTQADLVTTLQGDGPFTVFAPNDEAFTALLASNDDWNSLADIPAATLQSVLTYHVVSGKVMSGDLEAGYVPTLSAGPEGTNTSLMITTEGGAKFNDAGPVSVDNEASNGVVHIIDKVMMPMNMVDIATSNDEFSTLVSALQVTGLGVDFLAALADSENYTVFAPTNAAFEALLTELGAQSLSEVDPALLTNVLSYHIVAGNVQSGDLQAGAVPTLLAESNLTINLDSGVAIETGAGQSVPVKDANIQATNGVYHTIETVLLPN